MEDLGNINITIREGLGGRGSSGNVGGGPSGGLPQRSQQEMSQALQRVLSSHEAQVRRVTTTQADVPAQTGSLIERLANAQRLREEIGGFARRPTLSGATQILQQGTQTRTMLARLGTAASTVGLAMLGIGAVVGTAAAAIKGLQMASEQVSERISETWKYSGSTAGAMAEQRITEFALKIREASQNGDLYARVIRAQTEEMIAKNRLDVQLARATSDMAVVFSKLKITLFDYLTTVLKVSEKAREIAEYTPIVMGGRFATRFMERTFLNVEDSGLTMIQSLRLTLLRMIGQNDAANALQNEYMDEIARNTRKNNPAAMNEWFEADIKAITGLPV